MDKSEAIELTKKYINNIKEIIEVKKAYLFGSAANGTARPDSDIDIGLFTDTIDDNYLELLRKLYEKRITVDVRIEPHVFHIGHDRSGFSEEVEKIGIKIL